MMKKQSKRATFEDVGSAQDKIRKFIDDCITKNKILTLEEQDKFIRLFRETTLGFGANHKFFLITKRQTYNIGSVGHAALWIAYRTSTPIHMESGEDIKIKEFWKQLRDDLFTIFDEAINLSIKISQEQIHIGPSIAGGV